MRFRTHLIRNLLAVIGLFLLGAVLVISNISISLDKVRPVLVNALSQTLGREVNIEGDIRLSTGLFPALLIESLYAKNPEGFPDDYSLRISRAKAELSLIALIAGDSSASITGEVHKPAVAEFNERPIGICLQFPDTGIQPKAAVVGLPCFRSRSATG